MMSEVNINMSKQGAESISTALTDKTRIIKLNSFGKCKYMQYAVTTQCRNEQSIILSTGKKNMIILNKCLCDKNDPHYTFQKEGFITVEDNCITLELSKEQFVLYATNVFNDDKTAIATCTILFENSGTYDTDFNDTCINITAWSNIN